MTRQVETKDLGSKLIRMNIIFLCNRSEITIERESETIVSKMEGLVRRKTVSGEVVCGAH